MANVYENLISGNIIKLGDSVFPYYDRKDYRWMLDVCLPDIWGKTLQLGEVDEGYYETENVELKSTDYVVDAGANIGLFTAYAASKGCIVYAFEPLEKNVRNIETVKSLNSQYNISIFQCALSDYSGRVMLHNLGDDLGGGTIQEDILANNVARDHRKQNTTMTNVTSLDALYKIGAIERVDFIKADIEGSEIAMIEGAKEIIARFKPRLSLCSYHRVTDQQTLEALIISIRDDYKIVKGNKKIYAY